MPTGKPTPRPGSTSDKGGNGEGGTEGGSSSDGNRIYTVTDEAITQAGEDVREAAWNEMYEEMSGNYSPGAPGPATPDTKKIEETISWIVPRFEKFIEPFPRDFEAVLDELDLVIQKFPTVSCEGNSTDGVTFSSANFGNIDTAKDYMTQWEGHLSKKVTDWLETFDSIVTNQAMVLNMLRNDLIAMRTIYVKAREDVIQIGKDGVTALENTSGMPINNGDLGIALTVLAAFSGMASAGLGYAGKAGASLGTAVVSGGLSIGPGVTSEEEELPLSGAFVEDVLDNIAAALDQVEDDIATKEKELITSMDNNASTLSRFVMDSNSKKNPLVPLPPPSAPSDELKAGFAHWGSI